MILSLAESLREDRDAETEPEEHDQASLDLAEHVTRTWTLSNSVRSCIEKLLSLLIALLTQIKKHPEERLPIRAMCHIYQFITWVVFC